MHITLRPNEKIYINGAVLKVDRKVSIELMNDAVFLLEAHVMVERDATTPLRKLYFIVQLMLIEPLELEPKKVMFSLQAMAVSKAYQDGSIQMGLSAVTELVARGRAFEALKVIRSMVPLEDELLGRPPVVKGPAATASPAHSPNAAEPKARPVATSPRRGPRSAPLGATERSPVALPVV